MTRTVTWAPFLLLVVAGIGLNALHQSSETQPNRPASKSAQEDSELSLPPIPTVSEPAANGDLIREAYLFVAEHPDVAKYMPCFCNYCKREKHRSVEDCFVKQRTNGKSIKQWNKHSAECYVCLSVVKEVRNSYLEGKDLTSIRNQIENTFASQYKYHTPTPEVVIHAHEQRRQ